MTNSLFRLIILISLGIALAAVATAQGLPQRQLPAQGKRGETGAPLPLPLVQIGREVLRLAPGAVMYDASNRTIVHSALPTDADIYYTTDANGEVQRVYILTPLEQSLLDRAPRR